MEVSQLMYIKAVIWSQEDLDWGPILFQLSHAKILAELPV